MSRKKKKKQSFETKRIIIIESNEIRELRSVNQHAHRQNYDTLLLPRKKRNPFFFRRLLLPRAAQKLFNDRCTIGASSFRQKKLIQRRRLNFRPGVGIDDFYGARSNKKRTRGPTRGKKKKDLSRSPPLLSRDLQNILSSVFQSIRD